jgi:hypothetical protein
VHRVIEVRRLYKHFEPAEQVFVGRQESLEWMDYSSSASVRLTIDSPQKAAQSEQADETRETSSKSNEDDSDWLLLPR